MKLSHRRTAARPRVAPLVAAVLLAGLAPAQAESIFWKDGEYGAAGMPSPLAAADVVHAVAGFVPKSFAHDLTVNGTLLWDTAESADFTGPNTLLQNNGLVEFTGDGWLRRVGVTHVGFVNAGTLRKSGGSGELLIDLLLTNRAGAVLDAGSGSLRYHGGATFSTGTVFGGDGQHVLDSTAGFVFNGSFTAADDKLRFERGTFLSGTYAEALDPGVNLAWSGGTLQGRWRNGAGHTITAADGLDKVFASSFENAGTIVWNTTQSLGLDTVSAATTELDNTGVLDFRADGEVKAVNASTRLANQGTLIKSGGNGELLIGVATYGNFGAVFEAASGSIRYTGGGQMNGETRFSGSGWHVFDTENTFAFADTNVFKGHMHFAQGNFVVTGARLTPDVDLLWSGGSFIGNWGVAAGRTMTVVDGHDKAVGMSFVNDGTVAWNSSGELGLSQDGTVLRNNGLFVFAGDGRIRPLADKVSFDNAGTLRKAGGSGELVLDVTLHNRSGATLDAASGSLYYKADGTLDAGTVFSGAGQHIFDTASSYSFGGSFTAINNNVRFVRGSFVNPNATPLSLVTNLAWSGGVLQGNWGNAARRTLTASTGFDKVFAGDFTNDGNIVWNTRDAMFFRNANTKLQNNGLVDFADDGWLRPLAGGVTFQNAGVLRKSGGDGALQVDTALVNTGAIEVLAGSIVLPDVWLNSGTLRGSGRFSNERIDNKGDIAPGLASGDGRIATLRLDGRLDNVRGGTLSIDVGPAGASDLLVIGGELRLDGVLRVSGVNGYRPVLGDSFHVLSFASMSGAFSDVLELGFGSGVVFSPLWSATGLDLRVTAVPEPPTAALWAAALLGGLAGRRRLSRGAVCRR